jgi:hypothetical protein
MTDSSHVARLAEICAAGIDPTSRSFDDAFPGGPSDITPLLDALKVLDPRYLFDRRGRPAAVSAIRGALPGTERELFDAVMEDCECELAATREALFQVLRACQRQSPAAG